MMFNFNIILNESKDCDKAQVNQLEQMSADV